ncbi:MAG: lysine--tRNA ligase [Candidatus Bipolaricaulia bacterium]
MSDPLMQSRLDHLESLRARGIDPFPARVPAVQPIGDLTNRYEGLAGEERGGERVTIAGRLRAVRGMGKASFFDLRDGTGRLQAHATVDGLGEASYRELGRVDVGDILSVSGEIFRTKRGELTVAVEEYTFLAKAIRPLPEKWHGLKDVEQRHRHRSLDLIANDETREGFVKRSRAISAIRRTLDELGFVEVETPTLQPIAGGALARPFVTHHNTLDIDLYMRIALELYLKRVLVGGIDRVYEIGKCFRNEGVSTEHNPEFTMLEIYQAYADYGTMMDLAERLITEVLSATVGSLTIGYKETEIDFTPPWTRVKMLDLVKETSGIDVSALSADEIDRQASEKGIDLPAGTAGKKVEALHERFSEPTIVRPTFVCDYPIEISPLAKKCPEDERLVERFELYVGGMELANAFTELNDPIDQRERFEAQERLREAGDDEAHRIDEDFLFALEHGMPPAGGMGIGIDRLVMVATGIESIRDVILFPTLRGRRD